MLLHFQLMKLNCFKTLEQLGIGSYKTAHANKGIHNFYANSNRYFTVKHCRKHGYTLFCKDIGHNRGMLQHIKAVAICDQFISFFFCQLEAKAFRESLNVTAYLLIKAFGFNAIESS